MLQLRAQCIVHTARDWWWWCWWQSDRPTVWHPLALTHSLSAVSVLLSAFAHTTAYEVDARGYMSARFEDPYATLYVYIWKPVTWGWDVQMREKCIRHIADQTRMLICFIVTAHCSFVSKFTRWGKRATWIGTRLVLLSNGRTARTTPLPRSYLCVSHPARHQRDPSFNFLLGWRMLSAAYLSREFLRQQTTCEMGSLCARLWI